MDLALVRDLQEAPPERAWAAVLERAWTICSQPLDVDNVGATMTRRDRSLAPVDLFLATAAWDLWASWSEAVPRVADLLASWWARHDPGRAILVLDALSLREVPWILEGARERGYRVVDAKPVGAELPTETTTFARALGFGQRSALQNRGGRSDRLPGAVTDSVGSLPWRDCIGRVTSEPDWLLWHGWPDDRVHALKEPGHGLTALAAEMADQLRGEDFWALIERLTTGRRLVVTSDHGYAASGLFSDVPNKEQAQYLKGRFGGKREAVKATSAGPWVPPLDIVLETAAGRRAFVLGRRKWKIGGGFPALAHGGLTVLEVVVPWIELSRPRGA